MQNKKFNIKNLNEIFIKFSKNDKKLILIVIIGILGILLLFVSEFSGSASEKKLGTAEQKSAVAEYTYAEDLEKRLSSIISSIQGAGRTKVMLTLENGLESVYATGGASQREKDVKEENGKKEIQESSKDENEYILIKSGSSSQEALIVKIIQPKVRGVAIVCEGGDSAVTRQKILDMVTAVLNISAAKVSINKG